MEGEDLKAHPSNILVDIIVHEREEKEKLQVRVEQLTATLQQAHKELEELKRQVLFENNAHERELGIVFDESISMRAEMDYQATTMILENKRMKDQLAVYAVVEEQNKVLKEEVSRVHDEMKSKDLRHREEMENLKESLIEHKIKLQKEFRQRLQDVTGQLSAENAGSDDVKKNQAAGSNNIREQEERQQHISVLMDRFEQLELQHSKVKLEYGLAQQTLEFQTKELLQVKRELLESRERCASLDQNLKDAKTERDMYRKKSQETDRLRDKNLTLESEIESLHSKVQNATRLTETWKKRAMHAKSSITPEHSNPHVFPAVDKRRLAQDGRGNMQGRRGAAHGEMSFQSQSKDELTPQDSSLSWKQMEQTDPSFLLPDDDEDVRNIWNNQYSRVTLSNFSQRSSQDFHRAPSLLEFNLMPDRLRLLPSIT